MLDLAAAEVTSSVLPDCPALGSLCVRGSRAALGCRDGRVFLFDALTPSEATLAAKSADNNDDLLRPVPPPPFAARDVDGNPHGGEKGEGPNQTGTLLDKVLSEGGDGSECDGESRGMQHARIASVCLLMSAVMAALAVALPLLVERLGH